MKYPDFEYYHQVNASSRLFVHQFKDYFPSEVDHSEDMNWAAILMSFVAQSVAQRELVTTENCYLGLGVNLIAPGDYVFILLGSKSPVALRHSP
jgi:hypothetical protein